MINIIIAIVCIILWLVIFFTKPYYYASSKFWERFWIIVFCTIGGIGGAFIVQSIIYLCCGNTLI